MKVNNTGGTNGYSTRELWAWQSLLLKWQREEAGNQKYGNIRRIGRELMRRTSL